MNLKLMLEEAAGKYRGKVAIVSGDCRLSYTDLDEAANKVASALLGMGVEKGDRVALLLSNSPEFVTTLFGIVKTGAMAVPLDVYCHVNELTSLFNDFKPRVLVADGDALEQVVSALPTLKSIENVIEVGGGSGGRFHSYQEIMQASLVAKVESEIAPDDTAVVLYSSCSSYNPRGVMLSHRSLVNEAVISANGFQQTGRDIMMLFALPMYHVMGLVAGLLASIYSGSTIVMVPGTGLSLSSFLETIEKERGTIWLGVPYIFGLAADMAEKEGVSHNLGSLRLCGSAGAPLPLSTAQKFKKYYGFSLIDFWGLTEATCHVTCSPVSGDGRPGSVGKALPGWQVKIVDGKGGEMPSGRSGEIIVKGPAMQGYYNNPQATAQVMADGWLHTGDIGSFDVDGNLYITGRKKETVIVKGQNIHPSDLEVVLSAHPQVAEVAVIGVPDELRGEVVAAVIALKKGEVTTEYDLRRFCLEHLASYKAPKQFIFLDSLPRTASGEIDKEGIRQQLSIPSIFPVKEIT